MIFSLFSIEAVEFLEDLNESEMLIEDDQLILSSSLDCSFRIWSISNGKCLRQFYLYNCINKFDVLENSFVFALGRKQYSFK